MTVVRLTNVSRLFTSDGGHQITKAVDDVSVEIASGDRVGIVGRNGAGKSTLLQLIAGLSTPTSGVVEVHGRVTAIMTLGLGLRDHATGRENIYLDGELHGKSRADVNRVIDEVIDFSELGDFIEQPVRTYSTGMKARLAFSMLCHVEPELLIIDEALSVGDAAFARKATAKIREICARGTSVMLVSHSMTAIRDICNRCLWLESGRLVMDGSPLEVTDRYIDSVRRADNRDAVARFSRLAGSRSLVSGFDIAVTLPQGDETDRRVLESGAPLDVVVIAKVPPGESCDIVVEMVRLDGVRVFAQRVPAAEFTDGIGQIRLAIAMDPLVLGAAIYRLDASVQNRSATAASCSIVFEVYSPVTMTGGKPMLNYPVSIEVEKVIEC